MLTYCHEFSITITEFEQISVQKVKGLEKQSHCPLLRLCAESLRRSKPDEWEDPDCGAYLEEVFYLLCVAIFSPRQVFKEI